ncbi:MAG: hypothetical protein J6S91_11005, partial [Treponema sp.]|nr:hypothetical protein [Treponema sp.]
TEFANTHFLSNGDTLPTFNKVPAAKDTFNINNNSFEVDTTLYARVGNQNSLISHDVSTTLEGTLKGINLWSDNYTNKSTYGPVILGSNSAVDVQPTGFVFHNVGKATQDSVTLRFTTSSNRDEKLYIFVQDYEPSSQQDYTTEVTQE